jgi:RHS repeat-associated protein
MEPTSGVDDEVLALPKGGGAVQAIGTTFDVDLNTGTGSFGIPLELPMGPNAIRPNLTLRYSSGAGDGPFGLGWTLALMSVTRRTDLAVPTYGPADSFALAGNENLVATGPGEYRPVVDTLHWLIRAQEPGWVLTDTNDQVYRLGFTATGRISSTATGTERVGAWLLESMTDAFGNAVTYTWEADGNQRLLSQIRWGTYTLSFAYEPRPDRLMDGRFGFLVATTRRCRQISLEVAGVADPMVRAWDLRYDDGGGTGRSHLATVTVTGFGPGGTALASPTTTFGYAQAGQPTLTRFNGVQPPGLGSGRVELVDWDGNGLPDVLELAGGTARLWPNRGGCTWGDPSTIGQLPATFRYQAGAVAFADMDGNGTADLVVATGDLPGYYPLQPGGNFGPARIWRESPSAALAARGTRLADLDGTGRSSLLAAGDRTILRYQLGDDGAWSHTPAVLTRPGDPPLDLRDPHVSLADMTGDGLLDLIRVDGSGVIYHPSLGAGRWEAAIRMQPAPALPRNYDPDHMFLVDVDGDGCADLVYLDAGQILVWLNTGADRLVGPRVIAPTPAIRPRQVRLADMTGLGTTGVVFTAGAPGVGTGGRPPWLFLDPAGGVKPHLLTTINNGLGLTTRISYQPSTVYAERDRAAGQPWGTFHPFPVQCVDRVRQSDSVTGATSTVTYQYHDGRYDPASRAFLGFGRVESDAVGDASSPTTRTVTTFHLGLDPSSPDRPLTADERLHLGALRRRVLSTAIYGLDGSSAQASPYSVVRHQYDTIVQPALSGQSVVVPFERQTVSETWERGAASFATRQIDYVEVDAHGNVTRQRNRVTRAGQVAPDQDVTTVTTFAQGGTNLIASPARVTQTDGSGNVLSTSITYYDGPPFQGLPEGQITVGALSRVEVLVLTDALAQEVFGASQPDWASLSYHRLPAETGWWATRFSYQRSRGAGPVTLVTRGPRGAESTSTLDPSGQFVRSVRDPLGNVVKAMEDLRTWQTAEVTDPNGNATSDTFDALGRVTATVGPGDTAAFPSIYYDYRTDSLPMRLGTAQRVTSGQAEVRQSYQYMDGFGRALARLVHGEDDAGRAWIVTGATTYDAKGEVATVATPYYAEVPDWAPVPAGVSRIEQRYDALGRLVYQRTPGVSVTTWTFAPGKVTISRGPDGGTPTSFETHQLDGVGRTVAVARADGQRWVQASYSYDHANRMVASHSPDGAVTAMVYDLRGGLIRQTGVDTGVTRTVIDAAGNMAERRLPTGQTMTLSVDALNRVTAVHDSGSAAPAVSYSYLNTGDAPPPDGLQNRIGRLYSVTDGLGTVSFVYDAAGRPTGSLRRVSVRPGGSYETRTTYDQLGRITTLSLPAVTTGAASTTLTYTYDRRGLLSAAAGLVRTAEHDILGRLTRLVYENGTQNLAEFDPLSGRMSRQRVLAADGTVLRDQAFHFDPAGNLTSVDSPIALDAVQYSYDGLRRLTGARFGNGDQFGYAYSDGGNVTHVDGVGDLTYGAAPGSAAVAAQGSSAYTYDAAGRMATAPYGTLTFDGLDNLRSVTLPGGAGTIDYTYDFRGQRVVTSRSGQVVAVSVTAHLEFQEGVPVLWLPFGDARVAAVSGGNRLYLHPDLSGTPSLFTDGAGKLARRLAFGPYGTQRFDSNPASTLPNTGLICLGRRWYDPRIGRFISPDPLVPGVFNLDGWNPYIYAHNNPIAFMDPTGCSIWDVLAIIGVAIVVAALLVAAVFTGGATIAVAGVVINVSAGLMAATAVGIAGGAIVGGIAAARAGGSIAAGVLLGGLLGGIGAYTGGVLGAAAGGLFTQGSLAAYVATGIVQGTVAGAATGAAAGFAGGKGSAEQILLAMAKGAAMGAITGALLGAATHFLFGPNPASAAYPNGSPPDNYVGITASKWDPSQAAAAGLVSKATVKYVDQYASAGFDYTSEVADISKSGISGFNGNGITEWIGTGYIPGGSGTFQWTASGSFSEGFNLGGVLIGRGGMAIAIPVGWVPEAFMSSGAITSAVNLSMVLDYSGTISYANQLVFLGNLVPILNLALGAFEEFKYGWWENGKAEFSAVFSSNPNPRPPPQPPGP